VNVNFQPEAMLSQERLAGRRTGLSVSLHTELIKCLLHDTAMPDVLTLWKNYAKSYRPDVTEI
jgi:hypothetical protein